jgi:hypothetical protein
MTTLREKVAEAICRNNQTEDYSALAQRLKDSYLADADAAIAVILEALYNKELYLLGNQYWYEAKNKEKDHESSEPNS